MVQLNMLQFNKLYKVCIIHNEQMQARWLRHSVKNNKTGKLNDTTVKDTEKELSEPSSNFS